MTQPQTFREAAEQKERIDQQYKFRDIGYRRFVQEMESLDSHIVSLTIGKEALLDAAAELLGALEDIVIKAKRQRKQLSRLLNLSPECHVIRTSMAENALIVNGAKLAIAKAHGDDSP